MSPCWAVISDGSRITLPWWHVVSSTLSRASSLRAKGSQTPDAKGVEELAIKGLNCHRNCFCSNKKIHDDTV